MYDVTRALLAASAILGSLVLQGQTSKHTPEVGIFMDFESTPTTLSVEVMKSEAAKILQASGVSLDWRFARENRGKEAFASLVVLKFRGACRADSHLEAHNDFGSAGETRELGVTKVENGRVLPYSEVGCNEIREALNYLPWAGTKERQKALGLALGRVVAHELYHILAHTTGHAARGLAKASHSLEELVSARDIHFQEADSLAIAQALR
jgi:hypothetical protein